MAIEKIMVVDDELVSREYLHEVLVRNHYDVIMASNGLEAVERFGKEGCDLIFLDMKMPGMGGIEVLENIKRTTPETIIIIMTAYGTVESAVDAMKKGAYDYIIKPFSPDHIELLLARVQERQKLIEETKYWRSKATGNGVNGPVISKKSKMYEIYEQVKKVAQSKASILIQGESGTGKELIAHAVHHYSPRRDKPFIKVNCAALTETLLESELFGHEKGAFTGATSKREGRFELANEGTLLLDEISEISPSVQAKLLRVLEEEEFERVGGTKTLKIDTRIVATTNRNLRAEVENGHFREDLFFRLNVVPIMLPPLRHRQEDIPHLVEHFLEEFRKESPGSIKSISKEAMDLLCKYHWPGNVRELKNLIQRTVVMVSSEVLLPEHFMNGFFKNSSSQNVPHPSSCMAIEDVERDLILQTLETTGGNKTKAAETLKITTRTLRNKLNKYSKEDTSLQLVEEKIT
ncbi:MAG TPA: sigma-54 dependent transcriptional regulator [Candidatus Brocadiales bacterium]|nr:sigma-54 dependent transcriptional regulator [Candidatus Brocadiales bacterium]